MSNIKFQIQSLIAEALEELGVSGDNKSLVEVSFTANEDFGDLTSNIAMVLYPQLKRASANEKLTARGPRGLAEGIVGQINQKIQATRNKEQQHHSVRGFASNKKQVHNVDKAVTGDSLSADYSENVAPISLPQTLNSESNLAWNQILTKVEVAGPGFINFTLSEEFLYSQILPINRQDSRFRIQDLGFKNLPKSKSQNLKQAPQIESNNRDKKRITIEFTDPNPFKEFHLGHLFSNTVGESIARILESQGHEVIRLCYQGDVGMHVAKAVWGMFKQVKGQSANPKSIENLKFKIKNSDDGEIQDLVRDDKLLRENDDSGVEVSLTNQPINQSTTSLFLSQLEKKPLHDRIKILGQAYATGANAYKDDPSAQEEIKQINLLVFASAQKRLVEEENWQPQIDYTKLTEIDQEKLDAVEKLYRAGRAWSLEAFEQIYQRLGTKFEGYYFESVMGEYGYKIVQDNLGKVFEKSDGAVIFPGSKHGLHDRVFINSFGLPTYEAKELGLAPKKQADWNQDLSIIVTGNEINEYFKVLLKAMSLIDPEVAAKTKHIGHGMLRLPEGKMSSRTGNVLTGEMILDEAKARVEEIVSRNKEQGTRNKESTKFEMTNDKSNENLKNDLPARNASHSHACACRDAGVGSEAEILRQAQDDRFVGEDDSGVEDSSTHSLINQSTSQPINQLTSSVSEHTPKLTDVNSAPLTEGINNLSDQIAKAAVKYALLKSDVGSDVVFSFEDSISFTGNSGPYLQYTYARARSVLRRSQENVNVKDQMTNPKFEIRNTKNYLGFKIYDLRSNSPINPLTSSASEHTPNLSASLRIKSAPLVEGTSYPINPEERAVLNQLWKFSDALERAADEYAPHYVANYLYELAQRFNTFYNKHSILNEVQDEGTSNHSTIRYVAGKEQARLEITNAVAETIKTGLDLLGIEAPERM